MKKIIEDSTRSERKHLLPIGCRLIQESETRFGTHYQVSENFWKGAFHVPKMLDSNIGGNARAACSSFKNNLMSTGRLRDTRVLKQFSIASELLLIV